MDARTLFEEMVSGAENAWDYAQRAFPAPPGMRCEPNGPLHSLGNAAGRLRAALASAPAPGFRQSTRDVLTDAEAALISSEEDRQRMARRVAYLERVVSGVRRTQPEALRAAQADALRATEGGVA
jgi:hypothetical protein